jgi:hypothetical protein
VAIHYNTEYLNCEQHSEYNFVGTVNMWNFLMQTGTMGAGARAQSPDAERRNRERSGVAAGTSVSTNDEEKGRIAFDPAEMFTKDWRNYHCKTWHLEPTVR